MVEVPVPCIGTAPHRRTPIIDVSTPTGELSTSRVAPTGGHRAEPRPCTGGNHFIPVCVFYQTPPHLSHTINLEGYRIQEARSE
jgi:hypothetical protein